MTTPSRIGTYVALPLCALAAQPAFADTLKYDGFWQPNPITVHLSVPPAPANENYVYAGAFLMETNLGGTFAAWCVDVKDSLNISPTSPGNYTGMTGADYFGNAKSDKLARLATAHLGDVNNASTSGAFQMAVWEVAYETQSPYDLKVGDFYTQEGPRDTANTWLGSVNENIPITKSVWVWKADPQGTSQDLIVFLPVPEPETWAMMITGLGLMGFCASRRKA